MKGFMRFISLIFVLFLTVSASAETIVLISGDEIDGDVLSHDEKGIRVDLGDGLIVDYDIAEVYSFSGYQSNLEIMNNFNSYAVSVSDQLQWIYGVLYDFKEMSDDYDSADLVMIVTDLITETDLDIQGVKIVPQGLKENEARIIRTQKTTMGSVEDDAKFVLIITPDVALNPLKLKNLILHEEETTFADEQRAKVEQARKESLEDFFGEDNFSGDREEGKIQKAIGKKVSTAAIGLINKVNQLMSTEDLPESAKDVEVAYHYQTFDDIFGTVDGVEVPEVKELKYEPQGGIEDGTYAMYYDNGNMHKEISFVNGKKNGPYKEFYPSGKEKIKARYKDDVRVGAYKEYYENGHVLYWESYEDGNLHGDAKEFYADGVMKFEVVYNEGVLDGEAKDYFPSGQLKYVTIYKDGVLNGELFDYFENGQVMKESHYENNELVYEKVYSMDGKVLSEASR